MKRFFAIILCIIACVSPLVACGEGEDTSETTTYDYGKIPDTIEPHEERTVTSDELGYRASVVTGTSKYWVADAKVDETGAVIITSYNPGTTVITVKNSYAEVLELTVTVGLDYSIGSVEFEKFEMPDHYAYANDFGMKPTNADNASALQAAIDSLPDGGTVYIPRGKYTISVVELRDNITLRLEGVLAEYNTEFSSKIASTVEGSNFAVLKAKGSYMFLNHERKGWAREAAENIAIIGGAIDMQGKTSFLCLPCTNGFLLKNVVLKDCGNNHAIQISGSDNVTIRDCMFAGYNFVSNSSNAETIQIEQGADGVLGGGNDPDSRFFESEHYYCDNVRIENCYFGKSDKYPSHTYPIGHHGQTARSCADGVRIVGCTFDNPRATAIRCYAWNDVEIADNKFIFEESNAVSKDRKYAIELYFKSGEYALSNGVLLATAETRGGCQNYDIHGNDFIIGNQSHLKGILFSSNSGCYAYDAKSCSGVRITDGYPSPAKIFTGYKLVNNIVSDFTFRDNYIKIDNNAPSLYHLTYVKGIHFENNVVESAADFESCEVDGVEIYGGNLLKVTTKASHKRNFKVFALSANSTVPIIMMGGETDVEAFCTALNPKQNCVVSYTAGEGGVIERRADDDGLLYVEPIAEEGYVFDGYYLDGEKINSEKLEFSGNINLELRFARAE